MEVTIKDFVFWDMMPCGSSKKNRHFGGTLLSINSRTGAANSTAVVVAQCKGRWADVYILLFEVDATMGLTKEQ
jgi:hypothetical protein